MVKLKKILLALNTLTFASTQILLFTLLPILSEKLTVPLSVIIGCFSLGSFLFLWGAPFWSSRSDKLGRDQVMTIGIGALFLSFFMMVVLVYFSIPMGYTQTLIILVLSRLLYGSVASAIVPVAQLKNADMVKEGEHMSGMFSHSIALNLGRSIGPLLLLIGKDHIETLLLSISFWAFLLFILNFLTRSKKRVTHNQNIQKASTQKIWLPILVTILFTAYTGVIHSSLGETLKKVFTLSGLEASTLMAKVLLIGSVAMVVTQILGKIFLRKKTRIALFLGLAFLVIGAIILAFMTATIQMGAAIIFISMGIALIYPSHLALVHENYPKESMGKNIGLLSSGNTIGYAFGGALTSLLLNFEIHKIALVIVAFLCGAIFMNNKRMKV